MNIKFIVKMWFCSGIIYCRVIYNVKCTWN